MSKSWKNIVLVLLTIVVVVGVFLTIFFVEKNDPRNFPEKKIGEMCSADKVDFCVKSVDIKKSIEGVTAEDDNVWLIINVELTANKNFTIKTSHFNVDKIKLSKNVPNCMSDSQKINTGEQKSIRLAFKVPESSKTWRLYCFGYKVVLGSSLIGQPID